MTPEEDEQLHRLAEPPAADTSGPVDPAYSVTAAENGVMDDEDVLAVIRAYAGEEALATFPLRYQPANGTTGERVLIRPVQCPDGRYLAVSFRMGHEDPDEMVSWMPEWLGVDGPFTLDELEAFGRVSRERDRP